MEMPAGWKRHCDLKYADHQVDIDRIDAGNLMKQMAEALEYIKDHSEPNEAEICDRLLRKFKEWK